VYPVDVDYDSGFLLLTRAFDRHRLSLRCDKFHTGDNDIVPDDDNRGAGLAWTLSFRYTVSERLAIAVEWFSIKTAAAPGCIAISIPQRQKRNGSSARC
jgi:hypothetical protein